MENSSNSTNGERDANVPRFSLYYHPALITIALLICVSNAVVITLFMTRAFLRSFGNYILFSLAISDLAVGIFGIPMNIACETVLSWGTCLSSYCLNRFIAISTVYHILWITLEKFSAIIFPLQHKSRFDQGRIKIIILCTWLGSMFMTSVELIWLAGHGDPKKRYSEDVERKELIYNVVTFATCFVLPISVMIFAYSSIFLRILCRDSNYLRTHTRSERLFTKTHHILRKFKSALLFFTLLVVFILCWFWWFFVTVYYTFAKQVNISPHHKYIEEMLIAFRYSTSFINPMLYTFFKSDFRRALRQTTNGARPTPLSWPSISRKPANSSRT